MNKKLLFGMFLFAGVGTATAQSALVNLNKEISTAAVKNTNSTAPKALGTTVWHDDFTNMKTFDLTGTETSSTGSVWTADNSGQTGSKFGWTTDAVYDGWWITGTGANTFNSTSGGNFAELTNGNPSATPATQALSVNYKLTSPVIDVQALAGGSAVILSFEQTGAKFYDDQYVEVSTDGSTWTRVSDNASRLMTSQGNSNPYGNPEVIQIDIQSAIAGNPSTVQIRFGWTSVYPTNTNPNAWVTYGWLIDDVKIVTKPDFDLAQTYSDFHFTGYQYTQIPTTQISPVTFREGVRNQGTASITGLELTVTDGTTSASSTPLSLATASVDTLEADFTLSSTVGNYNIQKTISFNETDDMPSNNPALPATSFKVTDFVYACDYNSAWTEFPLDGLVDQNQNAIVITGVGNSFDIFNDQDVYGMEFRLYTGTAVNAEVSGELWEMNPSATEPANFWYGPLAETDFFTVTSTGQVSQVQKLAFNNPYALEAGKTYLVLLRLQNGTIKVASSGEADTGQGWINIDGTQVWGTFTDIPVVRMNFDPSLAVKNNNEMVSGVSVFPNPATDKAEVSFNLNAASNVTINVVDVNGKVVSTNSLNNLTVGANTASLNVAGLSTGVYSVVVKSDESTVTRKLVIK
ncbi:MAG: T9SS type A sorting domain-containing protein [Crocinitomicaceae bacterium]|nr:T9SS type A sorting domain-containing protein [Crocinitomicaceae bacterium]